jgi:hypothetical protein
MANSISSTDHHATNKCFPINEEADMKESKTSMNLEAHKSNEERAKLSDNLRVNRRNCILLVRVSLGVNIGVLVAVCTVLIAFGSSEPILFSWGPASPARGILLSIYFSILVISIVLIGLHIRVNSTSDVSTYNSNPARFAIDTMVAALLATQILYKITTPITAGAANPVALSNLGISVLHATTLYVLWNEYAANFSYKS